MMSEYCNVYNTVKPLMNDNPDRRPLLKLLFL